MAPTPTCYSPAVVWNGALMRLQVWRGRAGRVRYGRAGSSPGSASRPNCIKFACVRVVHNDVILDNRLTSRHRARGRTAERGSRCSCITRTSRDCESSAHPVHQNAFVLKRETATHLIPRQLLGPRANATSHASSLPAPSSPVASFLPSPWLDSSQRSGRKACGSGNNNGLRCTKGLLTATAVCPSDQTSGLYGV
jgi:hypothetical protein